MTLVPWWCLFLHILGCHSHVYKHGSIGSAWNGYEFHTYPHPAKRPGVPRDTMVDVINNLGLKLLAIHNEYNENNIAISPYGALSVLIALGEGLDGDAVYEIQQAANIPHDISIIRVGLRDVHRHLKSYFIPKEGFLAGLTLNHENVTLRPEYEDILKFYGYDIISFNSALYPEPDSTEKPQSTYGQVTTTEDATTLITTEIGRIDKDESTTEILARATTEFDATTAKFTTTVASETTTTFTPEISTNKITTDQTTLALPTTQEISTTTSLPQTSTETVTMEARTLKTTTEVPTTTELTTPQTTVSSTEKYTTTVIPTTTERVTTETATVVSTTQLYTTEEETTTQSDRSTRSIPTTTILSTTEPLTTSVVTEESTTSISIAESDSTEFSTAQSVLTTSLGRTTTNLPTTTTLETTTQNIITTVSLLSDADVDTTTSTSLTTFTIPFSSTANSNEDASTTPTTTESQEATSSSDVTVITTISEEDATTDNNAISEDGSSTMTTINDESTEDLINKDNEINDGTSADEEGFGGAPIRSTRSGQTNIVELNSKETTGYKRNTKRRSRSVLDYLIARYYDDHYDVPHLNHRPYVPKEQLSFLVYEKYREYDINFMKYDTVLPFHYVPHLNALALSFPLDSTKYYLLLLLPADETGIDKLVCDLRLNGSLRHIIANLRYTHVIATIPSFMLKGYVTLTPSFQKLGIRKVFEPRQADFSPMTNQRGIYVTNIEQAITVTIRNYVDPNTIEHYRNLRRYDPVHFKADHPFLYFVIDSEIHVTLMAGKIVNPLNSRIS